VEKTIHIKDVLEFAIAIETNGYKFYTETAKKFSGLKTVQMFHFLAEEELKHEHYFRSLMLQQPDFIPSPTLTDAYPIFREDFLNSFAFADRHTFDHTIETVDSFKDAIAHAIQFEKDTVVLYSSIRKHIDPQYHEQLSTIINEELGHIGLLLTLRESSDFVPDTEQYR
jgi:rubrerythrin